jgi:predicted dehydrogenase
MIKIALIGMGQMGLLHASLLNVMPDVKLVAFSEKNPLICRFARKIFRDTSIVADVKELSGFGLDAIYVITPISTHYPIVKTIYAEGIARNIFLEKPLASRYTESKELCNLAMNQGINMVGYNRRFAVTFKKAKEMMDSGTIGELIAFEGYAYSPVFLGVKASSKTPPKRVLPELGCHIIDLAVWFFGKLEVEEAKAESIVGPGSEDAVYLKVKTSRGLGGEIKTSWCMERYEATGLGLVIKGSKGTIKVEEDRLELKLNDGKLSFWHMHNLNDNVPFLLPRADYFREDETFVKAIIDNRNVEPNFQSSLEVDRIIAQVEEGKVE